jgi:hypothetical protein
VRLKEGMEIQDPSIARSRISYGAGEAQEKSAEERFISTENGLGKYL